MPIKIANVKIAFHVHATEDERKVLRALKNVLPPGVKITLVRDVYRGYYGNPIIRYEAFVKDSRDASKIFKFIFSNMHAFTYPDWIAERYDEREQVLYIRLDKQAAYLGEIKLGDGSDIIHFTFKFHKYCKLTARELEKHIEKLMRRGSE